MAVHPDSASFSAQRSQTLLAVILIVGATLLAYANSFPGIFVFDDVSSVLENRTIRTLWPLTAPLRPPVDAGVGGRPLANLSFALNHAISGRGVWGYHATNILLHLWCALTLFGIVRRTVGAASTRLALAVAVLWAVHPLATSTVNYVSQRTELLMALCLLLTLYAFIRRWFVAAIVACACGMACKETMVTAPVLVLLYDCTFVAGGFRAAWPARGRVHAALAATWLILAALMLNAPAGDRGVGLDLGVSMTRYALTSCRALIHYLHVALWPDALVFDYGWDYAQTFADVWPHVFAAIAIVFGSALALWRRPTLGFGCCAFLLLLAPTTSFVPIIQQPIAESRMYLPLAALIATAVGALHFFARRRAGAILAALVLAFIALTVARNRAYRSPLTLWSDTVAKAPQNARAQNYLGSALLEAGRANDALQAFARATTLRPAYADAHNNFGVALLQTGRTPDAIASLGNALRLNPQFAAAHFNLGNALAAAGRAAEARAEFLAALQINPRFAAAAYNLGILASRAGDARAAIAYFETALRIEPDYTEARRNLELARRRAGP